MKSIKLNRILRKIFYFLGILNSFLIYSSCNEKLSYEEYVAIELSKGELNDSIVYNVRFGMTFSEFDAYCLAMNKEKIFMPSHGGSAVRMKIEDGFKEPVYFDFFPTSSVNQYINKLTATMTYQNFSYYDKKYNIDNLVFESRIFFEKGYGGNKFIAIQSDNNLVKHNYVKIDGNRKIVLSPNFDGQTVNIIFENLNVGLSGISME